MSITLYPPIRKLKKSIIEEGAGYGKQLGFISEALDMVIRKLALDKLPADLSEEDRKIVVRFTDMLENIQRIKKEKSRSRAHVHYGMP